VPTEVAADVEPLTEADAMRVTVAAGEDAEPEIEPPAPVWEEAR
jgi:hypothetical protein